MAVRGLYFLDTGRFLSWAGRWALDWDQNERITAIVYCAIIDTDDGYVLVDTGLDPDLADDPAKFEKGEFGARKSTEFIGFGHAGSFKMLMRKEDNIVERLRERGLAPKDIKYVVNSHLHHDHVGGNRYFTDSRIVVHKTEYRFAMFPDSFYSLAYVRELWDIPSLHYELIEGDRVLVPGVTLIHTPGHTPGHLSVLIDCPRDGTVILIGDNAHHEHNYADRVPPGADNSMYPMLVLDCFDRIRAMADRSNALVVPTHDLHFWESKLKKEYH